jgi:mannose-6-phosphate isomerase
MLAAVSPILFVPQYMERVWGGRSLESLYGRELPEANIPYGESWELVDRPEACSVVAVGEWAGWSLEALWSERRAEVFGAGYSGAGRFPLLIKILDARDDLSIQVHPPEQLAEALGGEPKTEMWFIAHADPGAKLYVGLKRGITRAAFEAAVRSGEVAGLVHVIEPRRGESIFIPSGRLHAIGAGLVIFEIQQNSDTTYRVFDWNRTGLDGRPRELHVEASLECIDFADYEPAMTAANGSVLAACRHFEVVRETAAAGNLVSAPDAEHFAIFAVVTGKVEDNLGRIHGPGSILLMPRGAAPVRVLEEAEWLRISLPPHSC